MTYKEWIMVGMNWAGRCVSMGLGLVDEDDALYFARIKPAGAK